MAAIKPLLQKLGQILFRDNTLALCIAIAVLVPAILAFVFDADAQLVWSLVALGVGTAAFETVQRSKRK
jgi:hypothetical protein